MNYNGLSATIEQRNYFEPGDEIEVFGPNIENSRFIVQAISDENGLELDAARHPKQIIQIKIPFKVEKNDMLRLVKKKQF